MKTNSNYMGSGLAQTLDQKPNKDMVKGLAGSTSEQSLAVSTYSVPSLDGKSLIPAIPKHLALKFKPPTLAVVYQMKDAKSGKMKKYIHEIKIKFEEYETYPGGSVDVNKMCDELCRKETVYLHPACISRKQVQNFINQLHDKYIAGKERKAPQGASDQNQDPNFDPNKPRKKNFMERKRFVNYEENESLQKAADKEEEDILQAVAPTKEIRNGQIVETNGNNGFQLEEEEEVVMGGKKKPVKAEAVKSAPPKKDKDDKKQDTKPENSKMDDDKNKDSKDNQMNKKDDDFNLDGYSDDWGNGSSDDNKAPAMNNQPTTVIQQTQSNQIAQGASEDINKMNNLENYSDEKWDDDDAFDKNKNFGNQQQNDLNDLNFNQDMGQDFNGFANDNNSSPNDDNKMFDNEFDDLEKEFNQQNEMNEDKLGNQFGSNKNPFGNSITKELLVNSKQEIADELGKDIFEDNKNQNDGGPNNKYNKKNLEIDIDENVPFDLENDQVQQQLNKQLMEADIKQNQIDDPNQMGGIGGMQLDGDPNGSPQDDGSELEMTEEEILTELDNLNNLVQTDPELNKMLANDIENFGLEEKLMIIQAYKKGGVQGVKDIIEEEEEEEGDQNNQSQQQNNQMDQQVSNPGPGAQNGGGDEEDDEEVEIDLENEEDIKIIEDQFLQMVNSDERFRNNFGDEIFQLGPIQKYQIIDAYKQNGMEAVLVLLTESADQSGLQMDANGQSDMMGDNAGEESVIEHNGKKFQRVQIEGVGEGEDEYLMEIDTGDIYSLDFQFMSHMGDDVVIEEN